MPEHRKAPLQRTKTPPAHLDSRGGSSQHIKTVLFIHSYLEKSIPVLSVMVHDLKYFILINKQVPINCTWCCLRSRWQRMVFSCGCLAVMILYITTISINSWCERAPLINTELINWAAYTGRTTQNCLDLCSSSGWKCLIYMIPALFPQSFPSELVLKREQCFLWMSGLCTPVPRVTSFRVSDSLADLSCVTVSLRLSATFLEKVEASPKRSAGGLEIQRARSRMILTRLIL